MGRVRDASNKLLMQLENKDVMNTACASIHHSDALDNLPLSTVASSKAAVGFGCSNATLTLRKSSFFKRQLFLDASRFHSYPRKSRIAQVCYGLITQILSACERLQIVV